MQKTAFCEYNPDIWHKCEEYLAGQYPRCIPIPIFVIVTHPVQRETQGGKMTNLIRGTNHNSKKPLTANKQQYNETNL